MMGMDSRPLAYAPGSVCIGLLGWAERSPELPLDPDSHAPWGYHPGQHLA